MEPLEIQLRRRKSGPAAVGGALFLAAAVFVSMGLTQLNIKYVPPQPPEPLKEYHLPPPPPPPETEPPPDMANISVDFDLPITDGPADIALGFLDVEFGLNSKLLSHADLDINRSLDEFKTDGLDDLRVYDYSEVTKKPKAIYHPPLDIPRHLIGNTRQPVEFTYICHISASGEVSNVHIVGIDYPEAIPMLIKFVEGIRFSPPEKDGKKVSCIIRRKTTYKPSSSKSPFST